MHPIVIHPHPKTGNYCLYQRLEIAVLEHVFHIPKDFEFDGASIPPIFWAAFYSPYHPKVVTAGLAHDYLYATHLVGRKAADQIFEHLLKLSGVPNGRRRAMYLAVRAFGRRAWNRRYKRALIKHDSHGT